MTTKHPHCCLAILLTGLSVALERTTLRFERGSSKVGSFVFSYRAKEVEGYISKLLELFVNLGASDHEWVWLRVKEYCEHPLVEREKFLEHASEYFDIQHTHLSEDSFEYSSLSEKGRHLGEQVYEESRAFFMYLGTFLYQEWLKNGLSKSHNIVFFKLEE